MKKHWAAKLIDKSIKEMNNKFILPKFLRLPTPVDLGKAKTNALPSSRFNVNKQDQGYTWDDYRTEVRKDYPIKYFIFKTLSSWFNINIIKPISDFKYYIKSHTIKKYHLLDLRNEQYAYKFGWIDADFQMLLAMMRIMENFVIELDPKNRLIFLQAEKLRKDVDEWGIQSLENDIKRCEDLLSIQKWWRIDRPNNFKQLYDKIGTTLTDYEVSFAEEERLYAEDDEMMKKLIDMRGSMWT